MCYFFIVHLAEALKHYGDNLKNIILVVLPAALLHFSRSFTNHKALPDKVAIISNDASTWYKVINAKYLSQYSVDKSSFYSTDLMALTGTLDFTTDSSWLTITSLKT